MQDSNSSFENTDIVYNLQSILGDSSIVQSMSTLPISDSFYVHNKNIYAQLEQLDIDKNCISHNSKNALRLFSNIMCNKIVLLNFPIGQYTLNLNGNNVATAKFIDGNYTFDFNANKSDTLIATIQSLNKSFPDTFENKSCYLNLAKIDTIKLISSVFFDNDTQYKIKFEGYNQILVKTSKICCAYVNTVNLNLNHPTDCIDLHLQKINPNLESKMIFRLNDYEYATYSSPELNSIIRIKCKNLPTMQFEKGAQNCYLSENINQNTINMSRIDRMELILINYSFQKGTQHYYMCYRYPYRIAMFSN